ncbi:MAG: DNA repair protein RadC [Pseudomonadota bacterium]
MNMKTDCNELYGREKVNNTDIEVLASIVSSVTGKGLAAMTAQAMMDEFGDLGRILAADSKELRRGGNTPVEVIAEIERLKYLLRTILYRNMHQRPLLEDLSSVEIYYRAKLFDKKKEQLHVLYLDSGFELLSAECVQIGTVDHVAVYPREIMALAIENSAKHLILVHNHPSAAPEPCAADIVMTNELITACSFFGIHVADHLIVSRDDSFSFREAGLMNTPQVTIPRGKTSQQQTPVSENV